MLDGAQETIGCRQLRRFLRRDPSGFTERFEHFRGPIPAQRRVAATPDQLLGLGEEFDLADAAAPELDVVARRDDALTAPVGVDLAFDRMNVLDGGEVEGFAPQERAQVLQELLARQQIAGHRSRLYHRRAFPVLTHALVIGLGRQRRNGERRGAGIGPEAQIGPEHITLAGALLHHAHQLPGEPDEALLRALASGIGRFFVVIEHDEIDVARIVEFAGAEFAEAKHDESGTPFGIVGMFDLDLSRRGVFAKQMGGDDGEGLSGEGAQGFGDLLERPDAGDVGKRDQERRAGLGGAKGGHDTHRFPVSLLARRRGFIREPLTERPEGGVRPVAEQPAEETRVEEDGLGEVRAVAENGFQQGPAAGIMGQPFGELGQARLIGAGGGVPPTLEAKSGALTIGRFRQAGGIG